MPGAARIVVGDADEALDARLSAELDRHNEAATPTTAAQRELTVRATDHAGGLLGGVSGWTWGEASGIGLTWVAGAARGTGLGARLLAAFEDAARVRGVQRVFVTSFSFQAPGFYERLGYVEFARWEGVPREGSDDVHLRKQL